MLRIALITIAATALLAPAARAQESTTLSFHVASASGGAMEAAAEDCARSFAIPLNRSGAFVQRASSEVATIVTECTESVASPEYSRDCQLAMATSTVDYVVLVEADEERDGEWWFAASVLSPMRMATVWSDDEFVSGSRRRAASAACETLGSLFLADVGVYGGSPSAAVGARGAGRSSSGRPARLTQAVLEVMRPDPALVEVFVDGRSLGPANQQFLVDTGRHTVELRAPGYESHRATLEFEPNEVVALNDVRLEPEPAVIRLTADVHGAEIRVDGEPSGITVLRQAVPVQVDAGRRHIEVVRDGYLPWSRHVDVPPGGAANVSASLDVYVAPTCPDGFVIVEAGSFRMGSPSSEEGRDDDETQHRVTLTRDYCLQATEVTQAQWRDVMGTSPSEYEECGADCPVESVNWYDAVLYTNALSRAEGLDACYRVSGCTSGPDAECDSVSFVGLDCEGYRLPTEAEWEYAARAGTDTATYAGDMRIVGDSNAPVLGEIAVYAGNSGVSYSGAYDCSGWDERAESSSRCGPHPVASMRPNAWGLYDMLGNVWEWTWDWYGDDPTSATDPTGPATGSYRVDRGGSWNNLARFARAANRRNDSPGYRYGALGFRPARSLP